MLEPSPVNQVLILGAGRVGLEVTVQCALFGKQVVVHDRLTARELEFDGRLNAIGEGCVREKYCSLATWQAARQRIAFESELGRAAGATDLVIECVPESLEIKRQAFESLATFCRSQTMFVTSSSYLLPSSLAHASGRPDRLAGFHVHLPVWRTRVVDVMPHHGTAPQTVASLMRFGAEIGLLPIPLRKESPGYLFNALFLPLLFQAIRLLDRQVASLEDIDRAWMAVTEMTIGPFGMLDVVGLQTASQIAEHLSRTMHDASSKKIVEFLQRRIAATPAGVEPSFYHYPAPAFREPNFLPARIWPDPSRNEETKPTTAPFQRFIPAWVTAPLHPRLASPPVGRGSVACWGGSTAAECAAAASAAGQAACYLPETPLGTSCEPLVDRFPEAPVTHLVLAPDEFLPHHDTSRTLLERLESAFRVTQRWQRELEEQKVRDLACLTVVLPPSPRSPWLGLSGLARALFMEGAAEGALGPRIRIVSCDPQVTDWTAIIDREAALARASVIYGDPSELIQRHARAEVRYLQGERHELRYAATPVGKATRVHPTGHWLFTGGGRGITFACAAALGARYPVHLHLLGRSYDPSRPWGTLPPPQLDRLRADVMRQAFAAGQKPNEAWSRVESQIETEQNLRRLKEAGLPHTFHVCDVSDPDQLRATVELIRRDGPIRGVVHGAGCEITGKFTKKTSAVFRQTVAAKVRGAWELVALARHEPLQAFIAFGSLGGRFGGVGQADYALANESMAAVVRGAALDHPQARVATLHWPGWTTLGMAARPESSRRLREAGHHFLSPELGTTCFLAELISERSDLDVAWISATELPTAWQLPPAPSH
jgi:3-hydroxybutyryl-CoA dehydrogenase